MATSLKLSDELKSRVQRAAGRQRRTPHWIMREAIEQYVSRDEQRASFVQEAFDSWQAFQQDGLHLTMDETRAWLDTWGTGKPAPECHK
nr:CopG family ribbon-helix-helix protein [Variovorax boronicumulans]